MEALTLQRDVEPRGRLKVMSTASRHACMAREYGVHASADCDFREELRALSTCYGKRA